MSRSNKKLIWPLPGMATFAIAAALAILVALPTGMVLAQQEHQALPPTALMQDDLIEAARYTSIQISWTEPDTPETVTGYRVDYSEDGMVWHPASPAHSGTTETYTDSTLDAGTTRHYRVFAEYNNSDLSAPLTMDPNNPATTLPPLKPLPPTLAADDLTPELDDAGDVSIVIDWDAPAPEQPGASVTSYQIDYSPDGITGWRVLVADTEAAESPSTDAVESEYTDETVPHDTERYYRVSAINAAGVGRSSLAYSASTMSAIDPDKPLPPTGLVAYPDGDDTIVLVWNATDGRPESDREMISATRWLIEYSRSCQDDDDLDNNGDVTDDGNPCTNVVESERDSINSDLPDLPLGNVVYEDADNRDWRFLVYVPGATTSYTHDGLTAEHTRDYRVFSVNDNGQSVSPSMSARATTGAEDDEGIPKAPTLARASSGLRTGDAADDDQGPPQSTVVIQWTPYDDADSSTDFDEAPENDLVTSYIVEVSIDDARSWAAVPGSPVTEVTDDDGSDVWRLVHTGLMAGSELHYRVRGVNMKGEGANSTEVFIQTASPVRVEWPATDTAADPAVTATTDLPGRIMLSWDALDNPAGTPITGYRIEVSEDGTSGWADIDGNEDADVTATAGATTYSYTHSDLGDDETRYYQVFAINRAGESQPSAVTMGKTAEVGAPEPEETPPGDASGLTGTVSGTDVSLSWTAGTNAQFHRVFGIRENDDGSLDYSDIVWQATGATGSATVDMTGKASGTWQFFVIAGRGTSADDADAVWSASWSAVEKVTY